MSNLQVFKPLGGGGQNLRRHRNSTRPPLHRQQKTQKPPQCRLRHSRTPSSCPQLSFWNPSTAPRHRLPLVTHRHLQLHRQRPLERRASQAQAHKTPNRRHHLLPPIQRTLFALAFLLLLTACAKETTASSSNDTTIEQRDSAGNWGEDCL